MSLKHATFLYELIDVEEEAREVRVVIDDMFSETLDNFINDLTNEVGH